MKNILSHTPGRLLVLAAWGLFVLVLTTQSAQVPFVHEVIRLYGDTEFGATVGHAALFGILTGVGYLWLSSWMGQRYALLLAMSLALLLGTGTELSQMLVADRTPSLADLLANWLGVFVVGFGVVYLSLPWAKSA